MLYQCTDTSSFGFEVRNEVSFPQAFFQKLEKIALILSINVLNVVIYRLIFLFKMQFLRFFPVGQNFFLLLYMIVYQSALFATKLPCPKTFLVTCLPDSKENIFFNNTVILIEEKKKYNDKCFSTLL